MRDGDAPSFHRMLKMDVASLLSDLGPSAGPQRSKNIQEHPDYAWPS